MRRTIFSRLDTRSSCPAPLGTVEASRVHEINVDTVETLFIWLVNLKQRTFDYIIYILDKRSSVDGVESLEFE